MPNGEIFERALLLLQAGRQAAAETLCRRHLSGEPEDPEALLALSLCLLQRSEFADALRAIEASIARQPEISMTHSIRGVCLAALGREKEALAAVQQADQLEPESDVALHFLAAIAGERWRTRNLARATLDRLEAISPNSASAALLRAFVELRSFRPLRAFRAARRSVSLDPENPQARALHAIFVSLLKRRKGSELMHQAMMLDPAEQVLRDMAISTGLNYWRPSLMPLFLINCLTPPLLPAFFLVAGWEFLIGRPRRFKKLSPELQGFLRQAVRLKRPYVFWRWVLIVTVPIISIWTPILVILVFSGQLKNPRELLVFFGLWGLVAVAIWRRALWWRVAARSRRPQVDRGVQAQGAVLEPSGVSSAVDAGVDQECLHQRRASDIPPERQTAQAIVLRCGLGRLVVDPQAPTKTLLVGRRTLKVRYPFAIQRKGKNHASMARAISSVPPRLWATSSAAESWWKAPASG